MDEQVEQVSESNETESINDIAMFKSGGAAKADVTPKGEPAAPPAAERDESGRFKSPTSKEEKTEAPAAAPEVKAETPAPVAATPATATADEKPTGTLAALMAERAKRQALERELAAARAAKPAEPTDFFADPDKAVKELVAQQTAPIRQRFFDQSLRNATKAHEDFEAAAVNFSQMLENNPSLHAEWLASDDPGEFAYERGSNTPEFRKAMESKHRETVSAKDTEIAALKAKVATLEASQNARAAVPESLNRQPSGAVPDREDDESDIKQIVRFKSG